jgi:hypothetical protein
MPPSSVSLPSRFLGPPFGEKSIRISGALDGTLTTSPVRLQGFCFSPFMHPGVPSVPCTSSTAPSPEIERKHPGCLGSENSPTKGEGAALAPPAVASVSNAPTAVAAAILLKVTTELDEESDFDAPATTGPIGRFEWMLMRPLEGTLVGVIPDRATAFIRGMVYARRRVTHENEIHRLSDFLVPRHRLKRNSETSKSTQHDDLRFRRSPTVLCSCPRTRV